MDNRETAQISFRTVSVDIYLFQENGATGYHFSFRTVSVDIYLSLLLMGL